jgi:hypothetical protein
MWMVFLVGIGMVLLGWCSWWDGMMLWGFDMDARGVCFGVGWCEFAQV